MYKKYVLFLASLSSLYCGEPAAPESDSVRNPSGYFTDKAIDEILGGLEQEDLKRKDLTSGLVRPEDFKDGLKLKKAMRGNEEKK